MRTFVAIELPQPLRERLHQVQLRLKQGLPARTVRWVAPENLHLTLRFLGETSPAQREQLAAGLAELVLGQAGFGLFLGGLGVFPNYRQWRVVWVGLHGELPALEKLFYRVEQLAQQIGFAAEEKPLSPHITVGRAGQHVSTADGREAAATLQQLARQPELEGTLGQFTVDHLVHFHSELRPGGSVYTPLDRFDFRSRSLRAD